MPLMEWKSEYSVGIPDIDSDHKTFIEIINRVGESADAGTPVEWALQELEEYAQYHFDREEKRMKSAGYPDYEDHILAHHLFTEWLQCVKRSISLEPETRSILAGTINDYLETWLAKHILEIDMKYKGKLN